MIDPPAYLSLDGRRIFHETCRRLESDNRPPERFVTTICQYAQSVDEWQKACCDIINEGTIIETRTGRRVANPRLQVRDLAHARITKLADELGLTPTSPIAKDEPWDPDAYCDTLEDIIADMEAEALESAQPDGTA
jgi:P27 family predicted phage terminase small subunit